MFFLLRHKRILFWHAILAVIAGFLCFVPLFNVLGYEFSLAMALAVSFAASSAGVSVANMSAQRVADGTDEEAHDIVVFVRSIVVGVSLLAVPLLLITLNGLRVRNCNYAQGVAWFLVLPVWSAIVAALIGAMWGTVLKSARFAKSAAFVTIIISCGWSVYRFYTQPPVALYNPFWGYFAGSLYDETIAIRSPLIFSRLHDLCGAASALLLACAITRVHSVKRIAWLVLSMVSFVALTATAGALGFSVTDKRLRHQLGGQYESAHFDIVYPKELSPAEVRLLVNDHEFRYAQLVPVLGEHQEKIHSFVFRNSDEKRHWLGSGGVQIAKPWQSSIYLERATFPHRVLKHELVHVLARRYGDPLLGISLAWHWEHGVLPLPKLNIGLTEGIAVALDWPPFGDMDLHQRAAALLKLGLAPDLTHVFGPAFWTHASSRAYVVAGSFCHYLLTQHGARKLLATHRNAGNFSAVYGCPLRTLQKKWRRWLSENVYVSPQVVQSVALAARRPSVFVRPCAHELARLGAMAQSAQNDGDHRQAARFFAQIAQFDPADPMHRFNQFNELLAAGCSKSALTVAHKEILADPTEQPALRRLTFERIGDLYWRARDLAAARTNYTQAQSLSATSFAARRTLALKQYAISSAEPLRSLLMAYLVLPTSATKRNAVRDIDLAQQITIVAPDSGIGPYLAARQLAANKQTQRAVELLQVALFRGLPNTAFVWEAYRLLSECAYRADRLKEAQTAALALTVFSMTRGRQLTMHDWIERIAWQEGGYPALPPSADHTRNCSGPGSSTGSRFSGASRP